MQNIFTTILTFILGLFLAFSGLLALLLPLTAGLRNSLAYLLTEKPGLIAMIGFPVFLIGALIVAYLLINSRKRYFYIRGGKESLQVSINVVGTYISEYLKNLFGLRDLACNVHCRKERLTISANLPYVPEEEQETLSHKINSDIELILLDKIGYVRPFNLSLSFEGKSIKARLL